MSTNELYDKKNPFPAPVLEVRHITDASSPKETINIAFNLTNSGIEYTTGDALAVQPENDVALVNLLVARLGLDPAEAICTPAGTESLYNLLREAYEITSIGRPVLNKWLPFVTEGADKLAALLAAEDKTLASNYCWGKDVLDLATDYPATFPTATDFINTLKKLNVRLYSIASSPKTYPTQVHLCVGTVRYTTAGRVRGGVCSTYMADRLPTGAKAKVFVHSNKNFRLPEDTSTPIIMVGPGAGIAPFRAFWQERTITNATGGAWLIFGNPYSKSDFCYEDEIMALVTAGKLKLSLAWSREQAEKIYVQHLMVKEGAELWQWLQKGACFYVCGNAARMAKDVDATLREVICTHGSMSPEEADAYVADMKANKRYQRDVY